MQDGAVRTVWECPWWRVEERPYRGPDGRERLWYTARRPNPHTVHILGLTEGGLTPVLRQWRVPLQDWVWELPAGLCDRAGEPIQEAARRELLEETGFEAGELHHLLCATVSPGLTDELYNAFLGLKLVRLQDGGGTGSERIELHLVPFAGLEQHFLEAAARGEWVDAKLLTHIALAARKLAELKRQETALPI